MTMPGQDDTRTATVVLTANVQPYGQQMQQAAVETNRLSGVVDTLDAKISGLNKRAGHKLTSFSKADMVVLGGTVATAATLEKQLGTLNATAAVTHTRMDGAKDSVEGVFTKFPRARGEIIAVEEALAGLGITGPRELGKLTATFVKLEAATHEPVGELADGVVKLSRLMGTRNVEQIGNYANALLTVTKNQGVSATGTLSFAQSIAPLARQAGIGEGAVLGIAAAFNKAGADGYVAGNTFNSILGDISQLVQSGSPELAKYANLIGVTVDQFKAMDKTTAIERIFQTIAQQGPKAITTLNALGIDGVRAQSAISGVVQSGNLSESIAQAVGSSHDQRNLQAGSKAAMGGLGDSLATLRNNFTQTGTEIGTTFVRPLDAGVTTVNRMFTALNMLIKPFAPLIAVLAASSGVIGAVTGAALGAATVIGTGALLRSAIRSGPRRAVREGLQVGRATRAGLPAPESESAARYAAGTLPLRARLPYQGAVALGRVLPLPRPGDGGGAPAQVARAFVRAPFRVTAGLVNDQRKFLANSLRDDYDRTPYQGQYGSVRGRFSDTIAAARAENAASVAHVSTLRAVTREAGALGAAFGRLSLQTARTGVGLAGGAVGRGVGTLAGMLGSALFGPVGLIGLPVAMGLYSHAKSAAKSNITDDEYLNPVSRYNDALGIATTNLASFSAAVNTAATGTSNLNGITATSTRSAAATVTRSDIANIQGQKPSDSTVAALSGVRGAHTDAASLGQLARSYNMSDPRQVQMFKNNALAAGFDPATVTTALTATQAPADPAKATEFGALAHSVQSTEARRTGWARFISDPNNASQRGGIIRQSALSQIGTDYNTNVSHGEDYAVQKRLTDELSYFGSYADNFKGTVRGGKDNDEKVRRKELADALSSTFKGGAKDYLKALDRIDFTGMSAQKRQQAIVGVIGATQEGRNALGTVKTTDVGKFGSTLSQLYGTGNSNAAEEAIKATGPLGRFALADKRVQLATQNVGDPNAQYRGTQALADNAIRMGRGFEGAIGALDRLKASIQDVNNPLYQMAEAARQFVQRQQSYQLPTMSRAGQAEAAVATYRSASADYGRSAAVNGQASPDAAQNLVQAEQGYQQAKEQQRQYLISVYTTAQQYGLGMQRAEEDRQRTTFRAERDFDISMLQAHQDYYKSRMRGQRDFNISMSQGEQDHQRQVYRSMRDFNISLSQQAESAAQNIYNPFLRVQAQYTADAGTTVQNLEDQNKRITDQVQQLKQLSKMGLSDQAIQELDLSAPGNAQQTNNLVSSLAQNPQLIAQINKEVGARLQGTTALTQNSFNLQFTQTVQGFRRSLSDAAVDFQTARDRAAAGQQRALSDMATDFDTMTRRAAEAQRRGLGDMATDYRTMVRRSGEDLKLAMTEVYGSYADVFTRTIGQVNKGIAKYAPQAAQVIQSNLDKLHLPEFMDLKYSGLQFTPTIGGQGVDQGTARNNERYGRLDGHAAGGISTTEHIARFSEANKAEMIVPLDQQGLTFLTAFTQQVSMAMVRQMQTRQVTPSGGAGGSSASYDLSTEFSGPIYVTANDPDQLRRELAAEARMKRLRMPPRATAASL